MTLLLLLVLIGLVAVFLKRQTLPAPVARGATIVLVVAAAALIIRGRQTTDLATPFQAVFRSGGYGLGRLLVESGQPPGSVLLLLTGEGEIDRWRRVGFEDALQGSGFTLAATTNLAVDLQSGCFAQDAFLAVLQDRHDLPYVAAFAGLPGQPDRSSRARFVAFHPYDVEAMAAWRQSGHLLGVLSPRRDVTVLPPRGARPEALLETYFLTRK